MGLSPTSNFNSAINLQFLKYISLRHVVVVKVRGNVLVVFWGVLFVRFLFFFVIVVGVIFFLGGRGCFGWVCLHSILL